MTFQACYNLWLEAEIRPEVWDSDLFPVRSGHRTLEEVNEAVQELRHLGPPWSGRSFRLLSPEGRILETLEAPQPQAGGPRV